MNVNRASEGTGGFIPSTEERSRSHVVQVGTSGASLWQGGGEVATPPRLTPHCGTNVRTLIGIHLVKGPA